jgi:hypothetical protein
MVAASGATSHDYVVNIGGVEPHAVAKAVQNLSQDALRMDVMQRTCVFPFASRGADGVNNPSFAFHDVPPFGCGYCSQPPRGLNLMARHLGRNHWGCK